MSKDNLEKEIEILKRTGVEKQLMTPKLNNNSELFNYSTVTQQQHEPQMFQTCNIPTTVSNATASYGAIYPEQPPKYIIKEKKYTTPASNVYDKHANRKEANQMNISQQQYLREESIFDKLNAEFDKIDEKLHMPNQGANNMVLNDSDYYRGSSSKLTLIDQLVNETLNKSKNKHNASICSTANANYYEFDNLNNGTMIMIGSDVTKKNTVEFDAHKAKKKLIKNRQSNATNKPATNLNNTVFNDAESTKTTTQASARNSRSLNQSPYYNSARTNSLGNISRKLMEPSNENAFFKPNFVNFSNEYLNNIPAEAFKIIDFQDDILNKFQQEAFNTPSEVYDQPKYYQTPTQPQQNPPKPQSILVKKRPKSVAVLESNYYPMSDPSKSTQSLQMSMNAAKLHPHVNVGACSNTNIYVRSNLQNK